jgi:hypothetical protein
LGIFARVDLEGSAGAAEQVNTALCRVDLDAHRDISGPEFLPRGLEVRAPVGLGLARDE